MNRFTKRPRLIGVLIGFALAAFTFAAPATGQEGAAENKDSTTEAPADSSPDPSGSPARESPAETIPLEEIGVRSQQTIQDISRLSADQDRPALLTEITEELPETNKTLDEVGAALDSMAGSGRGGRRLRQIGDVLSVSENQLDDWQNRLVSLTRDIQEKISQADIEKKLWTATREAIATEEGAESLLEQVDKVLEQVNTSREQLVSHRDDALSAQAEVSGSLNRLTNLRQKQEELNRLTRGRILRPDSPFIWNWAAISNGNADFSTEFGDPLKADLVSIRAYATNHEALFAIQFLIMVTTILFLIRVRRRHQETLENDPRTTSAAELLTHPLATGIVIALVLTPVLMPEPPLVLYRYAVFVLLIPVLILLRTTLTESARGPATTTILLYALMRLSGHLPEFSYSQRITALAVALIGTAAVIHQWKSIRVDSPGSIPARNRMHRFLNRIGLLVYPLAALTNIFGLYAFSDRVLSGYIAVVTLALILIAGSNAIREFLRIAMVVGPLRHTSAVRYHYATVDRTISRVLNLAALALWVVVALLVFNIFTPLKDAANSVLDQGWQVGALSISVGSIIAFALAIWLSVMVSKTVRFVVDADILPRLDLPRGIPSTISMFINYGIITLGLLIALAAAGIDLSQISLIIGALGVGIGFGLQNLVNNFVSGLILIFERPIKVGDKVQFGTNFGEVKSIGIRASNVRSFDGAEIIVPNGNLISNEVINWTLSDQQRRMDISVGVAYGNDPEKVIELLKGVVAGFDDALKDPEPFISFDAFGESSLDFTVRFWIDDFSIGLKLKSAILTAICKALDEAGIEIPFPQRDLHVRSVDAFAGQALTGQPGPDAKPGP